MTRNRPPARLRFSPFKIISHYMGDARTIIIMLVPILALNAWTAINTDSTFNRTWAHFAALLVGFYGGAFIERHEPFAVWLVELEGVPQPPPGIELPEGVQLPKISTEVARWGTERKAQRFLEYMQNEGLPPGMQAVVRRR